MKLDGIALPDIPRSWQVTFLIVAMVIMRSFGIDSWTTALLSSVMGYLFGKDITEEKHRKNKK